MVHIDWSQIPNSGLGAYLTYLGARTLKPECKEVSERILEDSFQHVSDTREELQAELPNGRGVTLTLISAENSNHNCDYWPSTAKTLEARFAKKDLDVSSLFGSPTEIVKLVGYGIDSHPELENRPVGGIGFLGFHQESDYEPVSGIAFSEDLCIDLGTYGPLITTGMYW
jgi:hypothetical protein